MGRRHEDREMRLWSTSPEVDDVGAGSSTCYKGSPQQEGDRRWNAWALPSARRMQESTRGIREDHAQSEGDDRRGRSGRGLGVSPIGEPLPSLGSSLCCRGHGLDVMLVSDCLFNRTLKVPEEQEDGTFNVVSKEQTAVDGGVRGEEGMTGLPMKKEKRTCG